MFQNKNKTSLITAILVTFLINLPRLLIIFKGNENGIQFDVTLPDVMLRVCVLFGLSWLVLFVNLNCIISSSKLKRILKEVFINFGLLILGVVVFTVFKQILVPSLMFKRQLIFMTFVTYLIVVILLVVVARLVKLNESHQNQLIENEKVKQKALEHQLEALRSQINPHFLFNTLSSLKALIQQKSDKSAEYIDQLSWLLRSTLERSEQDFISLMDELEYLKSYMFLQKERFGTKLLLRIELPEHLGKKEIPSFSLQLLVENAIKHNIVSNKQPLIIKIEMENDYIIVQNPIQSRRDSSNNSLGLGLINLSRRFKLLKGKDIKIDKSDNHFIVKLPI